MIFKISILYYYFYIVIKKVKKKLPSYIQNIFYKSIHKRIRDESSSESLEYECTPLQNKLLKENIDTDIWIKLQNFPQIIKPKKRLNIVHLKNSIIDKNGIIIVNNRISKFSSIYRRLNLYSILRTNYFNFKNNTKPTIDSCYFVPRQFVDNGTWGDYMLEFLLPLLCADLDKNIPVLLECDFILKYAPKDLDQLNVRNIITPSSGLNVRNMYVIPPCQSFDNFDLENIIKIKEKLPVVQNQSVETKKIYLSRYGLKNIGNKNNRIIKNELSVEKYLKRKGFLVIRAHEMDNNTIRMHLSRADIVVGGWGSAFINVMWGTPSTIIEIADTNCWGPACVKMGLAMNVKNYIIIKTESDKTLDLSKLNKHLQKYDYGPIG